MNSETWRAREYHEQTKHAPETLEAGRRIDAALVPRPYKLYRDIETLPLDLTARPDASAAQELKTLSRLLHYAAGIIRRTTVQGQDIAFRAAPCTGALYHIELYVVCGPLDALAAGVYHYGAHDDSLGRLRAGDFRRALLEAASWPDASAPPEALLVLTSTFWRNAWRYEERAYRHTFWDSGTIMANLLALAEAYEVPASVLVGFRDAAVNQLIGVDGRREAAVSIVALGRSPAPVAPAPDAEPLTLETVPLSRVEIEYPAITLMQGASELVNCAEVEAWRDGRPVGAHGRAPLQRHGIERDPSGRPALEGVIERRGSARRFRREPISRAALLSILDAAMAPITVDVPTSPPLSPSPSTERGKGERLTDAFVIVNAVEGIALGAYRYEPAERALVPIAVGDFREQAGHLALDQQLAADAAANVYFLTDLEQVLDRLGNRGYRAAQLEGGIRGGRVYLAAYGIGLKATGLTFFDDEVIEFFGEVAAGKDVMFLVAVGR